MPTEADTCRKLAVPELQQPIKSRALGVETGGSNTQFGASPENGRMVITGKRVRCAVDGSVRRHPTANVAGRKAETANRSLSNT